jgi:small subunit ribosomal protein S18
VATQFKTKDSSKQFKRRKKRPCPLTIDQINVLDHNDIDFLKRFISDRGKILPRRNTGVSAKKQRIVSNAIKRARNLGLLPYCAD